MLYHLHPPASPSTRVTWSCLFKHHCLGRINRVGELSDSSGLPGDWKVHCGCGSHFPALGVGRPERTEGFDLNVLFRMEMEASPLFSAVAELVCSGSSPLLWTLKTLHA